MNNHKKLDTQEKIASKNLNVIPSGESILEKIGIDLTKMLKSAYVWTLGRRDRKV